ncbi:MAG: ABC transporter ATP-binding protein [Lachnospiraceae bacterium]|nr:ABC transporter ATP-binding protein [Lachnospiraceae bacterium]
MSKADEVFLKVEDLEVIYTSGKKNVQAVNKVSFELKKGQTIALVGETGAGKTTIAKSILRILPNPPAKMLGGRITLEGRELTSLSEEEMLDIRGGKIAMIFQDPMTALNPLMTVGDQIVEGLLLHNDYDKDAAENRAKEMLELVGIPKDRFVEYPYQFSGGMKQRVVIAMALACNPLLLLADEPTTALDVTIQAQVLDLIRNLKEKYNTSMILITHDLGVVAETSDTVAVVYAGEIIEYADKRELFINPCHPYTNGLFGSLPGMTEGESRLKPIAGSPPDPTDLPKGCAFAPRCPYVMDECIESKPDMKEISPGHFCRCIKAGKEI